MRLLLLLFLALHLSGCDRTKKNELTADQLLEKSIEAAGGEQFFHSEVTFRVNDLNYTMYRDFPKAVFTVETKKDTITYLARYSNGYPEYFINDTAMDIDAMTKGFIDRNLDAFLYLTSIPHIFDQTGVIIERDADVIIDQKRYETLHVKVPTSESQPQDEFYLYLDPETFYVHFRTEKFAMDGNRITFKRFYDHRYINGMLFSDYYTFYPETLEAPLESVYKEYLQRKVKEGINVSYEDITVEYLSHE